MSAADRLESDIAALVGDREAEEVMVVFRRQLPTLLTEMEKAGRVRRHLGTLLDNPFTSLTGRQMAKQILEILDGPA